MYSIMGLYLILINLYLKFTCSLNISFQVTPEVQHLHIKKYNMWWAMNCRKMKRSTRSRHRWSEENWNRNVDHCCVAVWACNEIAKMNDPRITQTMLDGMMDNFLTG